MSGLIGIVIGVISVIGCGWFGFRVQPYLVRRGWNSIDAFYAPYLGSIVALLIIVLSFLLFLL